MWCRSANQEGSRGHSFRSVPGASRPARRPLQRRSVFGGTLKASKNRSHESAPRPEGRMTLRESALDYCRRGWAGAPLRFEGSIEDRKRPLVESWEPNQKLPATEEQVTAWWQKWPTANVGIVMGAVSGLG